MSYNRGIGLLDDGLDAVEAAAGIAFTRADTAAAGVVSLTTRVAALEVAVALLKKAVGGNQQ